MQVLHRSNRAFRRPSEINSQVISDVIIENGIYLLQEYFCQTDKTRKCFVILSASRKRSLDRVDLRFGKDKFVGAYAPDIKYAWIRVRHRW